MKFLWCFYVGYVFSWISTEHWKAREIPLGWPRLWRVSAWALTIVLPGMFLMGCARVEAAPPWETTTTEISPSVYFFRHSGNECYVVRGVGVSCVKGAS